MRTAFAATTLALLLAAACGSSDDAQSPEEFRASFENELVEQIAEAELSADLESLAIASLTTCLEDTQPRSSSDTDDFSDCFATQLCTSDLVAPVWEGDTATCVEEARASFDFD